VVPEYVHKSKYAKAQQTIQDLEAELDKVRHHNRQLSRRNRALADQPEYVHRAKYVSAQTKIKTLQVDLSSLAKRYRKVLKHYIELTGGHLPGGDAARAKADSHER
jgi:chromosome segregation ATPase